MPQVESCDLRVKYENASISYSDMSKKIKSRCLQVISKENYIEKITRKQKMALSQMLSIEFSEVHQDSYGKGEYLYKILDGNPKSALFCTIKSKS